MIDIKVNFTDFAPDAASYVVGKTEGHLRIEGSSRQLVAEILSVLTALEKHHPEELMEAVELLIDKNSSHIFEMNKPE